MNLSSLVHAPQNQSEVHNDPQLSQRHMPSSQNLSPCRATYPRPKSNYPCIVSLPQTPPSPPADETPKYSLPSISCLLDLVNNSNLPLSNSVAPTSLGHHHHHPCQHQKRIHRERRETSSSSLSTKHTSSQTPRSYGGYFEFGSLLTGPPCSSSHSSADIPLTPPLDSDHIFDGRQSSPSVISNSETSVSYASTWELTPNLSSESINSQQRPQQQKSLLEKRPLTFSTHPKDHSGSGSNRSSSSSSSNSSSSSRHRNTKITHNTAPMQHQSSTSPSQLPGIFSQRSLPKHYSPSIPIGLSASSMGSSTSSPSSNPWQHHHYISPSSVASFPPSQDRYVCPTCNKAFSRPSSLRTHSYSHTGAKPFKCPYQGCGKAFSVRSNMKRHERGCHGFEGPIII